MFSFLKINKIKKSPFPLLIINNFIDKKLSKELASEINKTKSFDDLVMNGRFRVNKGSNNFKNLLKNSIKLKKFYNSINNYNFYKKLYKLLNDNFKKENWELNNNISRYSKKNYGLQKGVKLTKNLEKIFKKNTLNLDIDFSSCANGYYRSPHRDRDSRVINFLLYLNNVKKKEGGQLEVYDIKKNNLIDHYPRFPNIKNLKKVQNLRPISSTFIFFKSTPNSYHGVSKFKSITNKRTFLYGSFSLNNIVKWKKT